MTERERQMAELEAALTELIALGLVLEQEGTDTRTCYRVNPQKLSEIRTLLNVQSQPRRRHRPLSRRTRASSIAHGSEVPKPTSYN